MWNSSMNFAYWYIVITRDYYWLIMANTSSFIPIHGLEEDLDLFGPFGGVFNIGKKPLAFPRHGVRVSPPQWSPPNFILLKWLCLKFRGLKNPPPSGHQKGCTAPGVESGWSKHPEPRTGTSGDFWSPWHHGKWRSNVFFWAFQSVNTPWKGWLKNPFLKPPNIRCSDAGPTVSEKETLRNSRENTWKYHFAAFEIYSHL